MKFSGELSVPASREAVFDRLQDARFFASCVEGVKELNEISPTHYTAIFETKVAYIRFKFEVTVERTVAERPTSIAAKIEGKPHGIVGRLTATSVANFVELDGATTIHYAIEASLTGKLGSIGQPVLKSKAKEMERQFVENLRAAFPKRFTGGSRGIDLVTPFEWVEPSTLKEAVALLDPDDPSIRPIAGGTALMLMMKAGVFTPACLVSLAKIEPDHSQIRVGSDGLFIGAMASLSALEQSADVAAHFPVITRAMRTLSNVRVRNVARVGGALAHGDPHMDLPPLLAALDAKVSVMGPTGTRDIAVEDLYAGYYETVLGKDELIAEAKVPPLDGARAVFMKCTSRSADDWPALVVALRLEMECRDRIRAARLIVSAATEKVTRLKAAEKLLRGSVDDESLRRAGDAAVGEVSFLSDAHGSAAYKKELLRIYIARAVREALQ